MNFKDSIEKALNIMCRTNNVRVVFKGSSAYTTGNMVVLPTLPDEAEPTPELMSMIRGLADHEGPGHIRNSDFGILREIEFEPKDVQRMFRLIEDWRIELQVQKLGEGYKQNLQGAVTAMLKRSGRQDGKDDKNIMQRLWVEGRRQVLGQNIEGPDYLAETQFAFGNDFFKKVEALPGKKVGTRLALELAREALKRLEQAREMMQQAEQPDQPEQNNEKSEHRSEQQGQKAKLSERDGNKAADDENEGGAPHKSEQEQVSESKGEGSDEGSDTEPGKLGEQEGGVGNIETEEYIPEGMNGLLNKKVGEMEVQDVFEAIKEELEKLHESAIGGGTYMAYDDTQDTIEAIKTKPGDYKRYEELKNELGNLHTQRNKFARLFYTQTCAQWQGDKEQGRLNARALASVETGNRRVFKTRRQTRAPKTAVSFLVDFSGSMSHPIKDVDGKHVTLQRVAMRATTMLLETLTQLDVSTEVLGFTTARQGGSFVRKIWDEGGDPDHYGRAEKLVTHIVKEFHESYSREVKSRIGGYKNAKRSCNADADSVRLAYKRLKAQRADRKILLVLTDGQPCCDGNATLHRAELKRLAHIIDKDPETEIVGIGFGSQANVGAYYPNHFTVMDVPSFPQVLFNELKQLLRVA